MVVAIWVIVANGLMCNKKQHNYRTINKQKLLSKLKKPWLFVDLLKQCYWIESKNNKYLILSKNITNTMLMTKKYEILVIADEYFNVIYEIVDDINDLCNKYENTDIHINTQIEPDLLEMIHKCLESIENPKKLQLEIDELRKKLTLMITSLIIIKNNENKINNNINSNNINININNSRWMCFDCGVPNELKKDIYCRGCKIGINPWYFAIENNSKSFDYRNDFGILHFQTNRVTFIYLY